MKDHQSFKNISRAVFAASLTAGLSLSLTGCGDADAAKATAPPAGAESEVGSVVTGAKQSQHFDAVAQHLDLGGTLYGYFDIDGDVEKVANLIQGFLDFAKEEAGDNMPPHIKELDLSKVLSELGLDGIEAVGLSSIKKGDLYLNKAYAHIPAGRKGLLRVLGGDAEPFVAKKLAPADSDLIWEQSINLKAGFDVATAMVMRFGGPDALEQFEAATGEVNPQIGLSIAEIFGRLDTRLTVVGRVHPDKPLEIPDAPVEIPSFDLLIALDDAGWLFDKLVAKGKEEVPEEQQKEMFAKGDGWEKIMAPPLPSPDMVIVQPVIYHEHATKRVLIASTQAFLDECLSGKSSIADSSPFKTAMAGLPEEGNSLSYVSPEFMKAYRDLLQGMLQSSLLGGAEVMITSLIERAMPDTDAAQAGVVANTPEGILSISNAATSYKEAFVMGGVGMLAGMGGAIWSVRSSSPFEGDVPPAFDAIPEVREIEPRRVPPAEENGGR